MRSSHAIQPLTLAESWHDSPEFNSGRRARDWGGRRSFSAKPQAIDHAVKNQS